MMLPTWEGGHDYDAIALQETRLVNGGDWKCKLEKHCPRASNKKHHMCDDIREIPLK